MTRPLTTILVTAITIGLTLGAAACSKNDDEPRVPSATVGSAPPSTTTTEPPTTTTTIEDVKAEVEAAYLKAEAAFYKVARDPDPDHPLLEQHFAGAALKGVIEIIGTSRDEGVVVIYPEDRPPVSEILSVDVTSDDSALLKTCLEDDAIQIEAETRKVLDDETYFYRQEFEMARTDDQWVVIVAKVLEEGAAC